jgi:hypothetical protein
VPAGGTGDLRDGYHEIEVEVAGDLVRVLAGGEQRLAGCGHPLPRAEDEIGSVDVHDLGEAARKLDVLRQHCADEGRDYDRIEKTAGHRFDLGRNGENVTRTIEHLHTVAELGITQIHGPVARVSEPGQLDILGERVIPAVEHVGE